MTMTTSMPRFTVNWCTGAAESPAGCRGAGRGSSAMPGSRATAVPPFLLPRVCNECVG